MLCRRTRGAVGRLPMVALAALAACPGCRRAPPSQATEGARVLAGGAATRPLLATPARATPGEPARQQTFVARPERAVLWVSPSDPQAARDSAAPSTPAALPVAALPQRLAAETAADLEASLTAEGRAAALAFSSWPFYDVALTVDPQSGKLSAQVALDYPNRGEAALAMLPLRLFANAPGPSLRVEEVKASGRTATLEVGADPTVIRIRLEPPLPAGGWLHLTYAVAGTVPRSRATPEAALAAALQAGSAKAPDYGLFARFPGGVALADWLPLVAARWEGGFDVGPLAPVGDAAFAEVANFRAVVELPTGYQLAAPGAVLGEEYLGGRRTKTRLALAAGRDLALFASQNYRVAEGREGSTKVRVLYESGHAAQAQEVLTAARRALDGFAQRLGPYPWTTFTAAEVPLGGGAGGAEFSGLVAIAGMFFGPSALVGFGLSLSGAFLADLRRFTVTHEVAHQWWAIQVGNHPRLEPDVDEPLAQASAALFLGAGGRLGSKRVVDGQVALNYQAMRLLGGEDGPAARATAEFESTATYAGLVYGKAPLFYEALHQALGEGRFWAALSAYVEAHRFGVARRGDVLEAFAAAGPLRRPAFESLYAHWFGEAHGDVDLAGRGDPLAAAGDLFAGAGPAASGAEGVEDPLGGGEELLAKARAALQTIAAGAGGPQAGEAPMIDPANAAGLLKQLDQSLGGLDLPPAAP